MRVRCLILFVSCALLFCGGCASGGYKIVLRDGREFQTSTQPEFISKTGYYKFRTNTGKDSLIRSDEVLTVAPL